MRKWDLSNGGEKCYRLQQVNRYSFLRSGCQCGVASGLTAPPVRDIHECTACRSRPETRHQLRTSAKVRSSTAPFVVARVAFYISRPGRTGYQCPAQPQYCRGVLTF